MNSRDLAFLSSRFFALFLGFGTLYVIASFTPFILINPHASDGVGAIGGAIVFVSLISCLFFWLKAEWIAAKIVGKHSDQATTSASNLEDLQKVGFAVVGMFVLANVFPGIVGGISSLFVDGVNYTPKVVIYYIDLGVKFIVGLVLILGAEPITKMIKKNAW